MDTTEVRDLVMAYGEALNGQDIDAMVQYHADEIVSDSATMLARPEPMRTPQDLREWLSIFQEGFPDKSFTVLNIFVDDDSAVYQWRIQGTNTGPFRRITEPTHKEIDIHGCTVLHIENGRIVREKSYWDSALLLQQVGMFPPPKPEGTTSQLTTRVADLERLVGRLVLESEMIKNPQDWQSTRKLS